MKQWKLISTLMIAGAAGVPATAVSSGHGNDDFVVQAPVTQVQPLVSLIDVSTPQEVCWNEQLRQPAHRPRSATPVVAGGLIGGVVGHAIGDGRKSRRALTAVGALLGASIGYDQARRRAQPARTYVTTQRVCEIEQVVHQEERIDGYRVTYEYRGRSFVTQTATDPGTTIPVRVQVQPVTYNDQYSAGRKAGRRPFRS